MTVQANRRAMHWWGWDKTCDYRGRHAAFSKPGQVNDLMIVNLWSSLQVTVLCFAKEQTCAKQLPTFLSTKLFVSSRFYGPQ